MDNYYMPAGGVPEPVTDSSTRSNEKIHPIQQYLRDLVKPLPKVDQDGYLYHLKEGVCVTKKPNTEDKIFYKTRDSIRQVLPANPHFVPHPRDRAARHKPVGGFWDDPSMKKAREEFYIPAEKKVVIICPEIYDRDLLKKSQCHKLRGGGYMTPCPYCNNNYYVKHNRWNVMSKSTQKVLNPAMTQDIIVGMQYACNNPQCVTADKNGRKQPKTFVSYTKRCWKLQPELVRMKYFDYVVDIEDTTTNLMLSPAFSDRLLHHRSSFEEFQQDMERAHEHEALLAIRRYRDFCIEESMKFPEERSATMPEELYNWRKDQKWPAMDESLIRKYFPPPSSPTVIKMWEAVYDKSEHYLYQDFFGRGCGRIVRIDGTYGIMKVTMNAPDAECDNKVLVTALGEFKHIITFAFSGAEDRKCVERLMYYLRKRLLRLFGQRAVDEIIAVYSDVCCNNGDPKNHWMMRLFPGMGRAPLKDVWHGIELISRTTAGSSHPLHDAFKQQLWAAMLKWSWDSVEDALMCYRATDETGKTFKDKKLATEEMFKSKKWRKRIHNYISKRDITKTAAEFRSIYEATKKMDNELKQDADAKGVAYQRYFTRGVPNSDILGTEEAMNNTLDHINKGCFCDPLPPGEMSYRATKNPPRDKGPYVLNRLRGTNPNEITNKHGRIASVGNAGKQRSSLTHKRYMVYATRHNLSCDANIEHITGKKARPRDWFIRQALYDDLKKVSRTVIDDSMEYPPEFDRTKHMEPIGEYYQLETEWEKLDAEMVSFHNSRIQLRESGQNVLAFDWSAPDDNIEDEFGTMDGLADVDMTQFESAPAPAPVDNPPTTVATPTAPVASPVPYPADGGQAIFSARVQERSDAKQKAKPKNLLGAQRYGVRKAHISKQTVNNVYIHGVPNARQKHLLHQAHIHATQQLGSTASIDSICDLVAEIFNSWHYRALQEGTPGGEGGVMPVQQVKAFLKELGKSVVRKQLADRIHSPRAPAVATATKRSRPTMEELPTLGRKRMRELLKEAGLAQHGSPDECRAKLRKAYGYD